MAKKTAPEKRKQYKVEKREKAIIEGIMEGSPDAIGVVVVRLDCGCRKMAAVDKEGEPASKMIIYRDGALTVCDKCQADNGAFMRVTEQFISWTEKPEPEQQKIIEKKVFGDPLPH